MTSHPFTCEFATGKMCVDSRLLVTFPQWSIQNSSFPVVHFYCSEYSFHLTLQICKNSSFSMSSSPSGCTKQASENPFHFQTCQEYKFDARRRSVVVPKHVQHLRLPQDSWDAYIGRMQVLHANKSISNENKTIYTFFMSIVKLTEIIPIKISNNVSRVVNPSRFSYRKTFRLNGGSSYFIRFIYA